MDLHGAPSCALSPLIESIATPDVFVAPERLYAALAVMEATALEIASVERELALMAAHIKAKHAMASADTFAAALAQQCAARLVTGDPEFELLEGVVDVHWLPQRKS